MQPGHKLSHLPLTDERVSRLWEEVQHGGAGRLPREGVCSMSTSQMMYLYWSSLILCLVSSRSSNNGMFRCEFCGQGFIVAARLKHHRRNCQVLINKLLKSSKSQYQLIIALSVTSQANPVPTTHACKVGSHLVISIIYIK